MCAGSPTHVDSVIFLSVVFFSQPPKHVDVGVGNSSPIRRTMFGKVHFTQNIKAPCDFCFGTCLAFAHRLKECSCERLKLFTLLKKNVSVCFIYEP